MDRERGEAALDGRRTYLPVHSSAFFHKARKEHAVKRFPRKQCAPCTHILAAVARKIADKNLEQDRKEAEEEEDCIIIDRGEKAIIASVCITWG